MKEKNNFGEIRLEEDIQALKRSISRSEEELEHLLLIKRQKFIECNHEISEELKNGFRSKFEYWGGYY